MHEKKKDYKCEFARKFRKQKHEQNIHNDQNHVKKNYNVRQCSGRYINLTEKFANKLNFVGLIFFTSVPRKKIEIFFGAPRAGPLF